MRVLGAGDNVVDRYLDRASMFPGGNAINVAVFAARHGAQASYCGAVGTDAAGRLVFDALESEGVDLAHVLRREGPNAYATIDLCDGDRVFRTSEDGVSVIGLDEVLRTEPEAFDVLHTAYSGSLIDAVPELSRRVPVSFDFGPRFVAGYADYADSIMPHLWLASHSGAGLDDKGIAELLNFSHRKGARFALVTRGSDGAWLHDGAHVLRQPAVPARAVDTLGAGDAFIARVLVGLLRAEPAEIALASAARAASDTCTHYGAFGHAAPLPELPPTTGGESNDAAHQR